MSHGARLRLLADKIERRKPLTDEDRIDIATALRWSAILADNSSLPIKGALYDSTD
jgi:hypothetical protein